LKEAATVKVEKDRPAANERLEVRAELDRVKPS
jgi:hypothetical protein